MKVSVSTNPPKQENLMEYIACLNTLDIDSIHCDIMDGNFVETTTFDYKTVKQIRSITSLPLDVHLMVANVRVVKKYIKAGANCVTLHFEAFSNLDMAQKIFLKINKSGIKSGLAINPKTSVEDVLPILSYVNQVVIMTVEPGKSGQKMINSCLSKIKQIKKYLHNKGIDDVEIMVDGGVDDKNIELVKKSGADIVAVGSYIYNAKDRTSAIEKLTKIK